MRVKLSGVCGREACSKLVALKARQATTESTMLAVFIFFRNMIPSYNTRIIIVLSNTEYLTNQIETYVCSALPCVFTRDCSEIPRAPNPLDVVVVC